MKRNCSICILVVCILSGCMSIGPATIARDRFDYVSAISESWKDQMLLNIVKLRYADVPVFLDVSSVISQYGLEGIVNFSAGWNFVAPGDNQSFGGTGGYIPASSGPDSGRYVGIQEGTGALD